MWSRPWRPPSHARTREQNDRLAESAATLHRCLYTSTLMRFHTHPHLPCNAPTTPRTRQHATNTNAWPTLNAHCRPGAAAPTTIYSEPTHQSHCTSLPLCDANALRHGALANRSKLAQMFKSIPPGRHGEKHTSTITVRHSASTCDATTSPGNAKTTTSKATTNNSANVVVAWRQTQPSPPRRNASHTSPNATLLNLWWHDVSWWRQNK